jgi:presenilin-like A22 family membrane protease
MRFDVLLPVTVFIVVAASVLVYPRSERGLKTFLQGKLRPRDVVILVAVMGAMITVVALIPAMAIQILFISSYVYIMFFFAYLLTRRWYLALFPPVIFLAAYAISYLVYPNTVVSLLVTDVLAVAFSVMMTVYMGVLFSWKTMWIYATLLTVMDVIQVFGTGFMGQVAEKTIRLQLPVALILPAYPAGGQIGLGLGDIILSGLLAVQTALRYGRRAGILVAGTVCSAMFLFEVASMNLVSFRYFPATLIVVAGWGAGMAAIFLLRRRPGTNIPQTDASIGRDTPVP